MLYSPRLRRSPPKQGEGATNLWNLLVILVLACTAVVIEGIVARSEMQKVATIFHPIADYAVDMNHLLLRVVEEVQKVKEESESGPVDKYLLDQKSLQFLRVIVWLALRVVAGYG